MREAFEEWYSDHYKYLKAIERNGGGYVLMQAQLSWTAWQAAWKVCEERGAAHMLLILAVIVVCVQVFRHY